MVVFAAMSEARLRAIIGTTNVCHETSQIDQTPAASALLPPEVGLRLPSRPLLAENR